MMQIRPPSRTDRRLQAEGVPSVERRSAQVRELFVRVERKADARLTIYLVNEFVGHNLHLFDEVMGRLFPLQRGEHLELELSHVPYADSEALGRILGWARKAALAGATLAVVNPTPYVAGILEMLKLDEVVPIVRRHTFTPPPIP